jgi:hypothetical protein
VGFSILRSDARPLSRVLRQQGLHVSVWAGAQFVISGVQQIWVLDAKNISFGVVSWSPGVLSFDSQAPPAAIGTLLCPTSLFTRARL